MFLSLVLKEISSRNTAIASTYHSLARHLPPGPLCKLATSMAEQRHDLGKTLEEASVFHSLPESEIEFEVDPANAVSAATVAGAVGNAKELLKKMMEAELADHELLATVAGAVLPASVLIAERLASEAESARKRSVWAQDHLDLINIG